MTDRKKNRGRRFDEDEKPTKEEHAVAKFLRFNVPTREGKLHNMEVTCFFASPAVDALMESKWSASKNAKEPLFYNRSSCVHYCQRLMQKGLFHRAERVQRRKDKEKGDKSKKKKGKEVGDKEDTGTGDELRERKGKKEKKGKKEEGAVEKVQSSEKEEGEKKEEKAEEKKEEKKEDGKKKKEKRLKLIMTDDQRFLDGEENIYVWIYDPANAKTLVIGSLIVLGAIALCLFPLWPEVVRLGVYYLSLAAAGFVGFILALVVVRLILFCLIWVLTLGRHHFWLLPNLTEDVGFFDSFRPLYQHDRVARDPPPKDKAKSPTSAPSSSSSTLSASASKSGKKGDSKTKGGKKDKSSDKEESGSEQEEFEVIERGEVEREEEEGEEEGGAGDTDTAEKDDNGLEEEEEEEEEDYEEEEEEEEQNGALDNEEDEEDKDEDSTSKKDK